MEKTIITYDMYDHMMDKLVEMIEFSKLYTKVKYVYGPPRGGLPIAVHLAHHLGLEFVTKQDMDEWLNSDELEKVLIVDDVADTGKTLQEIRNNHGVYFTVATLHYKSRSVVKPDFFVEETDKWICYPWERLDEEPNRSECT
jgi:hypoxanthine phosphoribosyltransferase